MIESFADAPGSRSALELSIEETEIVTPPEKTHKLTVVSAPVITTFEEDSVSTVEMAVEESVTPVETPLPLEIPKPTVKPKRLIRDNDPALNYLDSVPTTLMVETAASAVCTHLFPNGVAQ